MCSPALCCSTMAKSKNESRSGCPNESSRSGSKYSTRRKDLKQRSKNIGSKDSKSSIVEAASAKYYYRCTFEPIYVLIERFEEKFVNATYKDALLNKNPFGPFISLLLGGKIDRYSMARCKSLTFSILEVYDKEKRGFRFGNKVVPLTVDDISLIFGLPNKGEKVLAYNKKYGKQSKGLVAEYFKDCVIVSKMDLENALESVLQLDPTDVNISKFVKLFVLYICNCFFFANGQRRTGWSFFRHFDEDLSMSNINWAAMIYEDLVERLNKEKKDNSCFDGCVVAFCYFLCIHVKSIPLEVGSEQLMPVAGRYNLTELVNHIPKGGLGCFSDTDVIYDVAKEAVDKGLPFGDVETKRLIGLEARLSQTMQSIDNMFDRIDKVEADNLLIRSRAEELEKENKNLRSRVSDLEVADILTSLGRKYGYGNVKEN